MHLAEVLEIYSPPQLPNRAPDTIGSRVGIFLLTY